MKGKKRISLLAVLVCVFALVFSLGILSACGSTDDQAAANQWYYGAEAPADTLGNEGDYYLNTKTLASYVKSENGTWTETAANWYYGTEEPVANLGAQNDFYLNTETGALYQKGAETWGSPILTLKGEQGKPGRDGVLWFSGKAVPEIDAPELKDAIVGDFYLNTADFTVWQRTETEWAELGSIMGRGTIWFDGSEEPDKADLKDVYEGDYYYRTYVDLVANTSNYQIYHYEGGKWILKATVVAGTIGSEFVKPDGESYLEVGDDGTVTVTGVSEDTTDLSVPGILNGKPVEIGAKAFQNNKKLKSVTLEEGVKEIGTDAFRGCSSLSEVTLSEGLETIGGMAFRECTSLQNVELPSSVKEIGAYAFCLDSELESVTFSEDLESIGAGVFAYCSSLSELDFSKNTALKEIGLNAFAFSKVGNVVLPDTVEVLGAGAFTNCDSLTSITLADGIKKINTATFYQCKSLTDVELPAGVTEIGPMSFEETKITDITFPSGLTEIGYQAFYNCKDLQNIILPDTVTKIGEMTFCNCTGAKTIKLSANLTTIPKWAFQYCDGVTELIIPNGVKEIGFNAFVSCENLPTLALPASVTSIVEGAFIDYKGAITVAADNPAFEAHDDLLLSKDVTHTLLWAKMDVSSVKIPVNVTRIAAYAFDTRKQLTAIDIPASVTSIGMQAFNGCELLADITLPDTIISIGRGAFGGTAYYNAGENWTGGAAKNGTLYMGNDNRYLICAYGATDGNTAIADGTVVIADNAFSESSNSNLGSVTIPASVISIGEDAFKACTKIASVTIPVGVTHIGGGAFHTDTQVTVAAGNEKFAVETVESADGNWNYLVEKETMTLLWAKPAENCTKIVLPDGIKQVATHAFFGCKTLTEIVIPASVTVIGKEAFSGCTAVTDVTFRGVISIDENAFINCKAIETITFETYTDEMKIHRDAFDENCTTLSDIVFGGTKAEWREWMNTAEFLVSFSQQVTITCNGEEGADNTMTYVSGEEL